MFEVEAGADEKQQIKFVWPYGQSVRGSVVTEAEVKFGYFLGEHHLAFKLADHATKLFSSMFPDSAITKDFKCGRSKATASPSILLHRMLGEALKLKCKTYVCSLCVCLLFKGCISLLAHIFAI